MSGGAIKIFNISLSGYSYNSSSSKSTFTRHLTWSCNYKRVFAVTGSYSVTAASNRDGSGIMSYVKCGATTSSKNSTNLWSIFPSFKTAKLYSADVNSIIDDGFKDGFSLCTYSNDTYTGAGSFSNLTMNLSIYYF